jgi:hypothetical protein
MQDKNMNGPKNFFRKVHYMEIENGVGFQDSLYLT